MLLDFSLFFTQKVSQIHYRGKEGLIFFTRSTLCSFFEEVRTEISSLVRNRTLLPEKITSASVQCSVIKYGSKLHKGTLSPCSINVQRQR